jgi:transcriptional regulator with XRE-family HTH domain
MSPSQLNMRNVKSAKTRKTPAANKASARKAMMPNMLSVAGVDLVDLDSASWEPIGQEEVKKRQEDLVARLTSRMVADGFNQSQLADELKISSSYVTSIFNGFRWVPKSARSVIKSLSFYLKVPVLQIFIWAGFFSALDLVSQDDLSNRLDKIYNEMINDARVMHIAPPKTDWVQLSLKTRLSFVMMYEIVSRNALLDHAEMEFPDDVVKKAKWVLGKD